VFLCVPVTEFNSSTDMVHVVSTSKVTSMLPRVALE
jgi:hypothetical protein